MTSGHFWFDTDLTVWLQSWSTPALTTAMQVVSACGYTEAYMAATVVMAFTVRMRPALVLLVLLALNAAITGAAKQVIASPRPDAVDVSIQTPGVLPALDRVEAAIRRATGGRLTFSAEDEDYGFPSGHASATAAFCLGVAVLFPFRWRWIAAGGWTTLMGLSRIYLGRHFPGDVIGGVAVGALAVGIGLRALSGRSLATAPASRDGCGTPWPLLLVAAVCVLLAATAGVPSASEAGRLLGIVVAAAVLTRDRAIAVSPAALTRAVQLVLAGAGCAAAWVAVLFTMDQTPWADTRLSAVLEAAVPAAALLLVPAYSLRSTPR
jgi:membrane-associated phospholipid phosphatase